MTGVTAHRSPTAAFGLLMGRPVVGVLAMVAATALMLLHARDMLFGEFWRGAVLVLPWAAAVAFGLRSERTRPVIAACVITYGLLFMALMARGLLPVYLD